MKIVILGAGGQLGQALCRVLPGEVVALTHASLDLTDPLALRQTLAALRPNLVVNAAGFTHVDLAEAEPHAAFAVNALAVRELAVVCQDLGAVLVHFSTNYVFGLDRLRDSAYDEDDVPGPINVYGASKLAGEYFVRAFCPRHFILRTCGLYGKPSESVGHGNFVAAILRQAALGVPMRVVNDQVCTPTAAGDLARAVIELLDSQAFGVYHVTNAGACTWHEFAKAILEMKGISIQLVPIPSVEYPAPAQRPDFSVLSNRRWLNAGFTAMRPWQEALRRYLHVMD